MFRALRTVLFMWALLAAPFAGVQAAPAAKKEKVNITADNMEVFDKDNKVLFTGNVKAVKGQTTLYTDRMEVFTAKEKQPDGSEKTRVRRLIAVGNVRIVKPNVTITGDHADMDVKKDIVVVTGNVVVKKPTATIRGDKMIANLKTNVTKIVTGGKSRVQGVFDQ